MSNHAGAHSGPCMHGHAPKRLGAADATANPNETDHKGTVNTLTNTINTT